MLRHSFCAAVIAAAGFACLGAVPARAADHEHAAHMLECAKICAACQVECDSCYAHCKMKVLEGKKEHAIPMQYCLDCADFCKLGASLSARQSPLAVEACDACAKACDKCAAECEKHKDDPRMMQCAKVCRECAKACRDMIEKMKK
jgi:hypothetical protein